MAAGSLHSHVGFYAEPGPMTVLDDIATQLSEGMRIDPAAIAGLVQPSMLPWDGWSDLEGPVTDPDDVRVLDEVARLTISDDLARVRTRYETDERLRAKAKVLRFFPDLVEDTVVELT